MMHTSLASGTARALTIVAVFAGALGLAGCDQPSASTDEKAKAVAKATPPPVPVSVSQPFVTEIVEWDEYAGRFDAVEAVEIRTRVSGHLTSVQIGRAHV